MSNYKMVNVNISTQHEQFTRFKTAYDYLNKITFTINGMNIDLLVGDIVSIMGISRVTNHRLKLRMHERSDDDIHDITIKKHYSLSTAFVSFRTVVVSLVSTPSSTPGSHNNYR